MNKNVLILLLAAGGVAAGVYFMQRQGLFTKKPSAIIPEGGLTWPPEEGGADREIWELIYRQYPDLKQYQELIFPTK